MRARAAVSDNVLENPSLHTLKVDCLSSLLVLEVRLDSRQVVPTNTNHRHKDLPFVHPCDVPETEENLLQRLLGCDLRRTLCVICCLCSANIGHVGSLAAEDFPCWNHSLINSCDLLEAESNTSSAERSLCLRNCPGLIGEDVSFEGMGYQTPQFSLQFAPLQDGHTFCWAYIPVSCRETCASQRETLLGSLMALTRATCRRRAHAWKQGLVAACGLLLAPFTENRPCRLSLSRQLLPCKASCHASSTVFVSMPMNFPSASGKAQLFSV